MGSMNGPWSVLGTLGAVGVLAVAGAARGSRARSQRPWAYHVTYADCLPGIARDGLLPQKDTPSAWGNPSGVYLVTRLGSYGGPKPDEPAWLRFPWPERVVGVSTGRSVTHADVVQFGEARTGPVAPDQIEILVDSDGALGRYEERGSTWVPLGAYIAGRTKGRDRHGSRARSPMYLWHGTSMAFLPSILRDGLRGPNWWGTKSMATYFADIAAEEAATPGGEHGGYAPDASTPVLICVPISRFDARKLAPDGNMIAEPMESLLEESTEDLYARWRASKGTWKDSLQIYEAVMYRGSIRITQDDVVAVSDAGEAGE